MTGDREHADPMPPAAGGSSQEPSNEYVLNVAFFSFLGFVMVQAVFALIARSEAMLADSEAMMVDALTYLFNLVAERIKNRPLQQESELMLAKSAVERHYDRELQRLYLELVPPSVSVLTLVAVTCMTLREASATLRTMGRNEETGEEDDEESVSLPIMLVFSAANLLLDIVNVSCFARANMNFGLDMVRREQYSINEGLRESSILRLDPENPTGNDGMRGAATEATALLEEAEETSYGHRTRRRRISSSDLYNPDKPQEIVNLNMCSAWTHVCADTMRSAAVLLAAAFGVLVPTVVPAEADAVAAIVVSVIILGSLFPLLQGLVMTAIQIASLSRHPPGLAL